MRVRVLAVFGMPCEIKVWVVAVDDGSTDVYVDPSLLKGGDGDVRALEAALNSTITPWKQPDASDVCDAIRALAG